MILLRFLRRLRTFAEYVGRPVHGEPRTGEVFRIAPSTAWAMACHRWPMPAEAERRRRENEADVAALLARIAAREDT
jgi:hypothetical protein